MPDDLDPDHYVRGAPEAARLLGGIHRTKVHQLVAAGRLRKWPAALIFPGARSIDPAFYKPELERVRRELKAAKGTSKQRRISGGATPEPSVAEAS